MAVIAGITFGLNVASCETEPSDAPAVLQKVSPDIIEYYWVDQHGNLVTTGGGAAVVASGATLAITAQGTGYTAVRWYLNGADTGQSGDTFYFSSAAAGNHTVSLFVEKDGKIYNTSITVTVQ